MTIIGEIWNYMTLMGENPGLEFCKNHVPENDQREKKNEL